MTGGADARCWWQPRPALRRYVCDLVADELFRQRRSSSCLPHPWPEALAFDQDLGVDSLERLALATALAESLHLHESGIEDYLLARHSLGEWVDIAEAGLARFSARLTFRTSGSSGVARPCMHPLASLLQETGELAAVCQDRLERLGQRSFLVGARHDDGVQVGGVNVFPSRVSAVLRLHPMVQDAAVRLMRPDEGARLKAYVVPRPEGRTRRCSWRNCAAGSIRS